MEPVKKDPLSLTLDSAFVTATMTKPNVESIIHSVATIIHSQMLEDLEDIAEDAKSVSHESALYYFSEEKYIEQKPESFSEEQKTLLRETPSIEAIYTFMHSLYECAEFSCECCILAMVYVNRLIGFTSLKLHPTNWRPLLLCALLVAQKVWDDRYLSNADFAIIYPFFVTEEINALEQKFLELI